MFEILTSSFKVTNHFAGVKICKQQPFLENRDGWAQGLCAAAGYTHLWAKNAKTEQEEFGNFRKAR
jgi:hypothetical protein